MILKRKAYEKMLKWKSDYAPDYVLFIKGARRTGKTTLAEEFGKNEYKSYITINFQKVNDEIRDLFKNSLEDLDYFFNIIQAHYGVKLYRNDSLIILDEIQLFPEARQALKTFLEDKRYDYIETGSLAGIKQKSKNRNILIPSEESELELFPLDFEEFLWAIGDDFTIDIIKKHYEEKRPFGALLKDIKKRFREYIIVGGMPQAVIKYVETRDFEKVDFIKRTIINLYKSDIKGQHDVNSDYVGNIFENIPSELSKHDKQFVLSHINKNARLKRYNESIGWLEDAMIVNVARNVEDPSPTLSLSLNEVRFKIYLGDTGLLINLAFDDGSFFDNQYYQDILLGKLHVNEGMVIENVVAQCLRANNHKIRYHIHSDSESKRTTREVDFLIRQGRKIVPIEVKSSNSKNVKSLIEFKENFSNRIVQPIVLHDGDVKQEDNILYFPYFMASII